MIWKSLAYEAFSIAGCFRREWPRTGFAVDNDPQAIRDSHVRKLRDLGLDDPEILEAISIAAFISTTNRIGIAPSVPPNREYTGIPAGRGRGSE